MIESDRIILKPLTYNQLEKYIRNDNSLENELNLNPTSRTISPELKEALENTILPNVAETEKNYFFPTLWTVISKADNKIVGDICIIGEPNAEGEIEIGYGTYDEFQRKGFMTEAVKCILKWAETEPKVNSILASTSKTNIPSFTVLEKNNFINTCKTETLFNWQFVIKQT